MYIHFSLLSFSYAFNPVVSDTIFAALCIAQVVFVGLLYNLSCSHVFRLLCSVTQGSV